MTERRLEDYAASRRTAEGAESYATKYDRELHKRISSWFERRTIARALARTGLADARVLDMPCGAGRLTPCLEPVARELVGADYSAAMLDVFGRAHAHPRALVDAFALPFADRSFDLAFSARLSHHIDDDARRLDHLRELLRVSAGWVIVTVFDAASLKNRLRELRRKLNPKKRRKYTLTRAAVADVCAEQGYRIAAAYPLSRLSSGHVFYVLQRG